jgi:hypothetical protein
MHTSSLMIARGHTSWYGRPAVIMWLATAQVTGNQQSLRALAQLNLRVIIRRH